MNTKSKTESWEKEFDDMFWSGLISPNPRFLRADGYGGNWVAVSQELKDFIRSLLTQQREEILRECSKNKGVRK